MASFPSRFLGILCLLFSANFIFAQGEANFWYFGHNAGLDFNSGAPVLLTNGALNTAEGCAVLSDTAGNLQFYTDGQNAYNRNHVVMPNGAGLMGHNSATQSAIIVPHPGIADNYFIFTVDVQGGTRGLRYSLVDMTLNGGLGAVTATKNVLLMGNSPEKVTSVKHCNGRDFWVLTHEFGNNNFRAYLVDPTGVNGFVTSSVGSSHFGSGANKIGYMRANSDGSKLAVAVFRQSLFEVFDFDPSTGIVSNPITLTNGRYYEAYGVEFSPDGELLYGTTLAAPCELFQWDLTAGNQAAIMASEVIIATSNSRYQWGAIQAGPDGMLYVGRRNASSSVPFLGRVANPNTRGIGCNFNQNAISLAPRNSNLGLPTFVSTIFKPNSSIQTHNTPTSTVNIDTFCLGDSTYFALTDTVNLDSVIWDFGDPGSGAANTSRLRTPAHFYASTGQWNVSARLFYQCRQDTLFDTLLVNPNPVANLGPDTLICGGTSLTLDPGAGFAGYLWSDASTNPTLTITTTGQYWVEVTQNACTDRDTIQVSLRPDPVVNLGNDTTVCQGETVNLNATNAGATYLWQDNSTNATLSATTQGTFWVDVDLNGCVVRDSIDISIDTPPLLDLGPDSSICAGTSLLLDASHPGAAYLWQDNSTNSTLNVSSAGLYWVESSLGVCSVRDSIVIGVTPLPVFSLGNDTALCQGPLLLDATFAGGSYLWQDNSTNPTFSATSSGLFWAEVTANACSFRDSIQVTLDTPPVFSLGNDTSICAGETLLLDATVAGATYLWQDNSTNPTFLASSAGLYWAETTSGTCVERDSLQLTVIPLPLVSLGNDTTICQGTALSLDVNRPGGSYLWSNGNSTAQQSFSNAGLIWVEVSENGCSDRDSLQLSIQVLPVVNLGPDQDICQGQSSSFDITQPGATYLWHDNSGLGTFTTSTSCLVWGEADLNGCSVRDSAIVNVIPLPVVNMGNDTAICDGEFITVDVTRPGGFYTWQNGTHGSVKNLSLTGLYWVEVTENGCSDRDSLVLTVHDLPLVDLGADQLLCEGETFTLDANANGQTTGAAYLWQDNSTASTFTGNSSGTYWVQTLRNGCPGGDTVSIAYEIPPVIDLGNDTTICEGTAILLDADPAGNYPGATFNWRFGGTGTTQLVEDPGFFWVQVITDACRIFDSIRISMQPMPVVNLGADTTLCIGETLELAAPNDPISTRLWSDSSSADFYLVETAETVSLTLSNECGTASDEIVVDFQECDCFLYLPNAFTPNGDGLNDEFSYSVTCPITEFHLRIFDRWGNLIFEANDAGQEWDGTFKGKPVQEGAYVWVLEYTGSRDLVEFSDSRKGSVTVLR